MTPRPYKPQERRKAVDAGRERILAAAQDVLHLDDLAAFSLDAVARRAGVTRMTVYNQFGSRSGLLEEVFDRLIEREAFSRWPEVFAQKHIASAFDTFVGMIGRFYTQNRAFLLRLSAAAGLDPDLDKAIRIRNERRRRAVETLVQRIDKSVRPTISPGELVNTLDVLLAFHTFNALAGEERTPEDVVPIMRQLVRGVLGDAGPQRPRRKAARTRARKRPRA